MGPGRGLRLLAVREEATFRVKGGLAEMLKGGVIMDVTDAEQARIAEQAGACAVMALERVPADIRAQAGWHAWRARPRSGDPGGGHDPRDGEGQDRAFRRGPGAGGTRGGLRRRVRGPDSRGRGATSTNGRSRCRSSAGRPTWARRCGGSPRGGHDPHEGRGGHGQRRRGGAPHAGDPVRDPPARHAGRVRAADRRGAARAARLLRKVATAQAGCRSSTSRPAASRRPRTRR